MFHLKNKYCAVNGIGAGFSAISMFPGEQVEVKNNGFTAAKSITQGTDKSPIQAPADKQGATNEKPEMPEPKAKPAVEIANGAVLSFGAGIVALIYEALQETKKSQRDSSLEMGLTMADLTDKQATEILEKAEDQFIADIVMASMQIVSGFVKTIGAAKTLSSGNKAFSEGADGLGKVFEGVGEVIKAIYSKKAAEHEAEIKSLEADSQRISAYRDQLKSITESLQEQAKSVLSSYQEMAQGSRDSLRKILA